MKFREKTYLVTLVLFLLFLNAGVFSLAYYTQSRAIVAEESICHTEQSLIVKAFEQDAENTGKHGKIMIKGEKLLEYQGLGKITPCMVKQLANTIKKEFQKFIKAG